MQTKGYTTFHFHGSDSVEVGESLKDKSRAGIIPNYSRDYTVVNDV